MSIVSDKAVNGIKDIEIERKEERYRLTCMYLDGLIDDIINTPEDENQAAFNGLIEYMNATLFFCKKLKKQIQIMKKEKKQNDTK